METLLAVLVVVQFIYQLVKDQQHLSHIKELELKLLTGEADSGTKSENDYGGSSLTDIVNVPVAKAVEAIRKAVKR